MALCWSRAVLSGEEGFRCLLHSIAVMVASLARHACAQESFIDMLLGVVGAGVPSGFNALSMVDINYIAGCYANPETCA